MPSPVDTDFLIIGSGIAGLSTALKCATVGTVAVITKKSDTDSNTNYAQGGIASVIAPDDSFDLHIADTIAAGAGLCHPDAVELIVRQGPRAIEDLIAFGVRFTRQAESLDLGREGGHSRHRIVHAKDLTGREIERALVQSVQSHPNIRVFENHVTLEVITGHHLGQSAGEKTVCFGVYALDTEGAKVMTFAARVTILCTGGCGQVYRHTTNPSIATGDGLAMAYRAGARVANLEFMQFHPTTLFHPDSKSFLISEAVRGRGAVLIDGSGNRFMEKYDSQKELAPRDIVARAIDAEMKKSGAPCVFLDLRHLAADEIKDHFPNIYEKCMAHQLDITRDPIPVVPAAHYMCGGIVTNLWGETDIDRLYACGEVACTGVHGANRLASNSLLEAVVFADRVFQSAAERIKKSNSAPALPPWDDSGTFDTDEWVLIEHNRSEVQQIMWDYVGIIRSNLRLERAQRRIDLIVNEIEDFYKRTKVSEGLIELRNLAKLAKLIIRCAKIRKESRGLHATTDYPQKDDAIGRRDTIISTFDNRYEESVRI